MFIDCCVAQKRTILQQKLRSYERELSYETFQLNSIIKDIRTYF